MKRIFIIFVAMMLCLTAIPVMAADTAPTVTVGTLETEVKAGDKVELAVKIANNPGFTDFQWVIEYDADKLEIVAIETSRTVIVDDEEIVSDYISGALVETNLNYAKGQAIITCAKTTNFTKNATLFKLVFKVKDTAAAGFAQVTIKSQRLASVGTLIEAEYVAGGATVVHVCGNATFVPAEDATCTEAGMGAYYKCACGKAYEDADCKNEIADLDSLKSDKLGHNYVGVVTDPTETEEGYTTYTCDRCGDSYIGDRVPAIGTPEDDDTTGGSTTGGSTTGGSTTGGSTTGGSTTGGSTTGGSTTGGSTTGGSTTGGSTTGGSTTGGSTTGGSTTGGSTTGGSTTGGSTTGGSTTGGSTTGGSTTGGSTTGGSTTGGSTTGGDTTGDNKITYIVDGEVYEVVEGEGAAPADPTKTGYTFMGWSYGEDEFGNATYTATWEINQYTITFIVDGEEYEAITQDFGTAVTAPADPTKEGSTFTGWDKAIPATMPAEDMTITATWNISQFTITFIVDGEEYEVITQDYGTAVTAPADPEKTGYTFAGWDKAIPATMPAEDMTITATWSTSQFTITFDTLGGTAIAPITQDYGTAVTAPADPTKAGYTFAGWDVAIPATMPAENMTITAKWTANKYVVKFDGTGNGVYAVMKDQNFTYGEAQELNKNEFIRDGYRFIGWATEEGGKVIFGDGEEVMNLATSGSITLYPVWELNTGVLDIKPILVCINKTEHGTVTMNRKMVPYGTYAYMTVTPDAGYEIDTIIAKTAYGYELKVYDNGDGTYKIKMPLAQVNVTVTFKKIEVAPVHECPAAKFEDINTDAWYHDAVDYMVENGLMNGVSATKFAPSTTLNRAMILTILWRLEGCPEVDFEMNFSDVEADQWYTAAIRWAASEGITTGFEDGTFQPKSAITRQQLAVMIYRYAESKGADMAITTVPTGTEDVADWAQTAVYWAIEKGIYVDRAGAIAAAEDATRAEAAAMIYNYAK